MCYFFSCVLVGILVFCNLIKITCSHDWLLKLTCSPGLERASQECPKNKHRKHLHHPCNHACVLWAGKGTVITGAHHGVAGTPAFSAGLTGRTAQSPVGSTHALLPPTPPCGALRFSSFSACGCVLAKIRLSKSLQL